MSIEISKNIVEVLAKDEQKQEADDPSHETAVGTYDYRLTGLALLMEGMAVDSSGYTAWLTRYAKMCDHNTACELCGYQCRCIE